MKALVFLLLAVVAQATVFQHLKEFGIAFDAALAVIIVMGFMGDGYPRLMIPAFFAGLLSDSMSGAPFGTMTAGLVITALALSALESILAREHIFHFAAFAFTGAVVFSATAFFITVLLSSRTVGISPIGVLRTIGYNAVGAFIIYCFSQWITLLKNRIGGR